MKETTTQTRLLIVLSLVLSAHIPLPSTPWSNSGYSADPSNPDYGTYDWIAKHALG